MLRRLLDLFRHARKASIAAQALAKGQGHEDAGETDLALACYAEAQAAGLAPPTAFVKMGNACATAKRLDDAERHYRSALALDTSYAPAHLGLGNLYRLRGDRDTAEACYRAATVAAPGFEGAAAALGTLLLEAGRPAAALPFLESAAARSNDPRIMLLHARALAAEGRNSDAIASLLLAAENDPDANVAAQLASTLLQEAKVAWSQGQLGAALSALQQAHALAPEDISVLLVLARALTGLDRNAEAEPCLRQAIAIAPSQDAAHSMLSTVLVNRGDYAEGIAALERALAIRPSTGYRAKLATLLPPIPASMDEIDACRERFLDRVRALTNANDRVADPIDEIGVTHFWLTYHGRDDRVHNTALSEMYRSLCPALSYVAPNLRSKGPGQRIRIGFLSRFLYYHSIGRSSIGLIERLPRELFDVTVLFVQSVSDDEYGRRIRAAADHTVLLPRRFGDACRAIADLELDILFFLEIGMDPFSYFLAHARLAPQQCTFFGHPDTTGISTIDSYLSAQSSEPPDAAEHYTETLVLLPDLAIPAYYERSKLRATKTREELGLPRDRRLYGCLQTVFKIHPDMDDVFADILGRDPEGELVFVEALGNPRWTELLRNRIVRRHPSIAERLRFVPYRVGDYYLSLAAACDVALDPFHFGGMNSSLDCFQVGTPVITLPGKFQRGRQTMALYQRMGIDDCVAIDAEDYASRAVSIAGSPARVEFSRRIDERSSRVFEDVAVIKAFTEGLVRLAG